MTRSRTPYPGEPLRRRPGGRRTWQCAPAQPGPGAGAVRVIRGTLDLSAAGAGPVLFVAPGTALGPGLLAESAGLLRTFDAVLGPGPGDSWWAFGLRDPRLLGHLTATPDGLAALALAALRLGLRVAMLPSPQVRAA
ncbi:MAG: hypothetical protein ABW000_15245 [Actinoplanes sp.]